MNHSWRQSDAAKAALILLTVILLWGTALSGAGTLLALNFMGSSNSNDAAKTYTETVSRRAYYDLENYLSASVRADTNALPYYKELFDPAATNLRFHATDSSGKVVLSNDGGASSENAEKLGTVNTTVSLDTVQRDYSVQQHFDTYEALQNANMAAYPDRPEDYLGWYFTNDAVDTAYHEGLYVCTMGDQYTSAEVFDTAAEAAAFDYEEKYGKGVTWEIVSGDAGDAIAGAPLEVPESAEDAEGKVVVLVTAYGEQYSYWTELAEYYDLKRAGDMIEAEDPELEALLNAGLDVTVTAKETVTELFTLTVWLPAGLPVADSIRDSFAAFKLLYGNAEWVMAALFLFGAAAVLSAIAMCSAAGHGSSGIVIPTVHKLPYEYFWVLPAAVAAGVFAAMDSLLYYAENWRIAAVCGAGLLLCLAASGVLWLYTTAIRAKSGTFWNSFGIVRFFKNIFSLFRHRTLSCIAIVAATVFLGVFNAVAFASRSLLILPAIGLDLLALLFMLYCIYSYYTLHQHLVQIEQGDFAPRRYVIPLSGDFLCFDRELNMLTDTVSTMVAEQIKAERMRTELITNVSHDLKTPLTSIVNYVDLLSREPMQSDAAEEYLDVLRRQAARLKKLTIDLVDASKASTGNLTVEMQITNIQVLLNQFSGEYEERLRASGLELVMHLPELPVFVLADGRLSWRIFDNLLNNACKYAMHGTRVYLDVTADENEVCISMKNISAAPLNVSPDELMERFVRGDASRHTEGSGLGLSIARDLAVLQGAALTLDVDGDLFKASLHFPRYEELPLLSDEVGV